MIRAGDLVADIGATDSFAHTAAFASELNDDKTVDSTCLVGRQSIRSDSTALDALKTMAERQADALLVMQDDHPMGIVSESDFLQKVVLEGKCSDDTSVSAIMDQAPVRIDANKTVSDVMRALVGDRERSIRDLKYYIMTSSETG